MLPLVGAHCACESTLRNEGATSLLATYVFCMAWCKHHSFLTIFTVHGLQAHHHQQRLWLNKEGDRKYFMMPSEEWITRDQDKNKLAGLVENECMNGAGRRDNRGVITGTFVNPFLSQSSFRMSGAHKVTTCKCPP